MKRLIVRLKVWDESRLEGIASDVGALHVGKTTPQLRGVRYDLPDGADEAAVLAAALAHPEVETAFFDFPVTHASTVAHDLVPGDPLVYQMWHLISLNVFPAWRYGKGSQSIRLGTCDTGIIPNHVDLAGTYDFGYNTSIDVADPTDITISASVTGVSPWYSHGTVTWSCMFATHDNAHGVAGVAPGCWGGVVAAGGVGDPDSGTYVFNIWEFTNGLVLLADQGVKIQTSSTVYGVPADPGPYQYIADAYQYIWDNGGMIFQAAGNMNYDFGIPDGNGRYTVWGGDETATHGSVANLHCILVSGIGLNDAWATWVPSGGHPNYGIPVQYVAPAVGIWAADIQPANYYEIAAGPDTYRANQGTSFATPLTAAVAALIWSANPALSAAQVLSILRASARSPLDATTRARCPNALIPDAHRGVLAALATVPANAGLIYPYVRFSGAGASQVVSGAALTTTLNGAVAVSVDGYSSDAITHVEVWVGSRLAYSGPPGTILGTASSTGTAVPLKVVAYTATGSAEETYTDVVVVSLDLGMEVGEAPPITEQVGGTFGAREAKAEAPTAAEAGTDRFAAQEARVQAQTPAEAQASQQAATEARAEAATPAEAAASQQAFRDARTETIPIVEVLSASPHRRLTLGATAIPLKFWYQGAWVEIPVWVSDGSNFH